MSEKTEKSPTWKNPPKAKVYEALSAVLDGRVTLLPDSRASVTSSSGDKVYTVTWTEGTNLIGSNDNASIFQGYIGYPIIAVLMATGRVEFEASKAKALAGVPWKQLNTKFKRNYEAAVEHVLQEAGLTAEERQELSAMVDGIYEQVTTMGLERLFGRSRAKE